MTLGSYILSGHVCVKIEDVSEPRGNNRNQTSRILEKSTGKRILCDKPKRWQTDLIKGRTTRSGQEATPMKTAATNIVTARITLATMIPNNKGTTTENLDNIELRNAVANNMSKILVQKWKLDQ